MSEEIENLSAIRAEATKHLRDGVIIGDIVYRPFDMGVFGKAGYSLVLCKRPNKILGVNFGEKPPTSETVAKQTLRIVEKLST